MHASQTRVTTPLRIGRVALGPRPCLIAAGGEAELDGLIAAATADVIELRADLFSAPSPEVIVAALTRLRSTGRPLLLTVRAAAEGGRAMPEPVRAAIYLAGLPLVDAIDIELSSTALRDDLLPRARATGTTALLSFHDFQATPSAAILHDIVTRAGGCGADITKIATTANTMDDVRTLLALTLECRDRGVATLAMGLIGSLSRLLFPAAGSLLTYASVGAATAPGQLPVAELAPLLRRFYPPGDVDPDAPG